VNTTVIKVARGLVWAVYLWVAITLVLLFLAFLLQLFGANPTAGFVEWVYRSTQRAMAPFRGIFESISLSDQSVLDVSVLFAMIVYAFVALGLHVGIEALTGVIQRREFDSQRRDLAAAQSARSPDQVVLLAGPTGETAHAVLTSHPWGTSIDLAASGLDPAQTYNVWLEGRAGGRVSAGIFQPDPTGEAQLSLTTPAGLGDTQTFGLTLVVPAGEPSRDVLASRLR
jgi:uncharacterized protein YggT (Ycf19 family)